MSASPLNGAQPPIFGPCLLWPSGWMDEDATWYGSRPRPRPPCIRQGPSSPRKGTAAPLSFRSMSIVATVAHLSYCWAFVAQLTAKCRRACTGVCFPPKITSLHEAICTPISVIHDSLGLSEPTTQMTAQSVQPFLHSPLLWQTDQRQTDHATRSVTIGHIYVRGATMRTKKQY